MATNLKDGFANIVVDKFSNLPSHEKLTVSETGRFHPGALQPTVLVDESINEPVLGIGLRRPSQLSLDSILELVAERLGTANHVACNPKQSKSELARAATVLAMACVASSRPAHNLDCLGLIIDTISISQIDQLLIANCTSGDQEAYEFGKFTFGRINKRALGKLFAQTGITTFDSWLPDLHGKLSLRRSPISVRIINVHDQFFKTRFKQKGIKRDWLQRLVDDYFNDLSDEIWPEFYRALDQQQAATNVAGNFKISLRQFTMPNEPTRLITVFSSSKVGRGWVSMSNFDLSSPLPPTPVMTQLASQLKEGLRVANLGDLGLDNDIQKFSEYFSAVADLRTDYRIEEAILHGVFAFDYLVGGKPGGSNLRTTFAERIAATVHIPFNLSFEEVKKFAKKAYDYRSAYAHRGEKIGQVVGLSGIADYQSALANVLNIGKILFAAVCWARQQSWCVDRNSWLDRIDHYRELLNSRSPTKEAITEAITILGLDRIRLVPVNYGPTHQAWRDGRINQHSVFVQAPTDFIYTIDW